MAEQPILAAGGIVVRGNTRPTVAIVQLSKDNSWVLPKGKLARGETALAAAEREVREETGQSVTVKEFVGTLCYETNGRPKIVQFWRMHPNGGPARELMDDIKQVAWLPLEKAIRKLARAHERAFLAGAGPAAIKSHRETSAIRVVPPSAAVPAPSLAPARTPVEPELVEPEAIETESVETEVVEADVVETAVAGTDVAETHVDEAAAVKPATIQSEIAKPEITAPAAVEPAAFDQPAGLARPGSIAIGSAGDPVSLRQHGVVLRALGWLRHRKA